MKNDKTRLFPAIAGRVRITVRLLCTLIMWGTCICYASGTSYAQTTLISLKIENHPLKDVFKQIEKKSEYIFLYHDADLDVDRKVSINVKDQTVEKILDKLFRDTGNTYKISDRQILILKKKPVEEKSKPKEAKEVKKIAGTVRDENGEPLIGLSVAIKGTPRGTITDINGKYEIDASKGETVVFSYVGYENTETIVGDSPVINVLMNETDLDLDEVVVVAYGTQKRLNVTGAVASISSRQLQQSPVANISNALAGRLPGLISVQRGGEPGNDGANIWIRGTGTYGSAQTPLFMVDGVERDFNNIDPNEIENITILKDASSTAIYGVRGANGVVLVTTKRGVETKPKVNVNLQTGLQAPTRMPQAMDAYNALHLYREGLINDGLDAAMYTDEYLEKYRDRSMPAYQYLYPNTNWAEELLKPYSTLYQANINVNGRTNIARYFVSVSYMQQDGLYKFEDVIKDYDIQARLDRYNFRSNVDLDITKDLSVEVNLGGIIRERNYPNVDSNDLFRRIKMLPGWWYPVTNPDGSLPAEESKIESPYGQLTRHGYRRNFESTLQATGGFTWQLPWITQGLSLKGRLSFDMLSYRDVTRAINPYSYKFQINDQETDLTKGVYKQIGTGSNTLSYDVNANMQRKNVVEFFLNYDRTFGKHDIKSLILYTRQNYMAGVGGGGAAAAIQGLPYKQQGIVGRVAYAYNNKYFGEFNFGYNGSEQFPKGKRLGFFPAFSAGWLLSGEDFLQKSSWINLLKLRVSAGIVGNDRIGDSRFLYQSQWSINEAGYQFWRINGSSGEWYSGAAETFTGNLDVTWERAKKMNIGLDLALWKNTLKAEIDLFYEYRDQILTDPLTIPDIVGVAYTLPKINAGIVENKGYELVLTYRKNWTDFGYFMRGNYSFARNKILELTEPAYVGREWQERTNRRVHEHSGLRSLGLFKDRDDINSSPVQTFGQVQPGDIKYADLNGDGIIDAQDSGYLGRVNIPESIAGLAIGFNYRNFDASILFQGAFGAYVYYGGPSIYPFSNQSGVLTEVLNNYFSAENNPDPRALYPRMTTNDNANNYRVSDFWHRKGDYLRLKNAEIGYSLPRSFLAKMGVEQARFYITALNLYTWSYIKTFDPEMPDEGDIYPQQKVFNFGFSFSF